MGGREVPRRVADTNLLHSLTPTSGDRSRFCRQTARLTPARDGLNRAAGPKPGRRRPWVTYFFAGRPGSAAASSGSGDRAVELGRHALGLLDELDVVLGQHALLI